MGGYRTATVAVASTRGGPHGALKFLSDWQGGELCLAVSKERTAQDGFIQGPVPSPRVAVKILLASHREPLTFALHFPCTE